MLLRGADYSIRSENENRIDRGLAPKLEYIIISMRLRIFLFSTWLLSVAFCVSAQGKTFDFGIFTMAGDSLITGSTYDVLLYSELEIEGVLTFEDSVSIVIKSKGDIYRIGKDQIKSILLVIPESTVGTNETEMKQKRQETSECEIYMKNRSSFKNVLITGLVDSLISIEKEGVRKKIDVFEVNKIKFKSDWTFWDGALMGAGIPLAVFIFYTSFADKHDKSYPGVLMISLGAIIPAGIIGGVIGIMTQKDDLYDFSNANPKAKLKRMNHIIKKHTIK
jgi:hypothetical protein